MIKNKLRLAVLSAFLFVTALGVVVLQSNDSTQKPSFTLAIGNDRLFAPVDMEPGDQLKNSVTLTSNILQSQDIYLSVDREINTGLTDSLRFQVRLDEQTVWSGKLNEIPTYPERELIVDDLPALADQEVVLAAVLPFDLANQYQAQTTPEFGLVFSSESTPFRSLLFGRSLL